MFVDHPEDTDVWWGGHRWGRSVGALAHDVHGRAAAANVITLSPGIPGLALIKARDIKASLEPFMPFSIEKTWQVWVQLLPLMFNLGQRQQWKTPFPAEHAQLTVDAAVANIDQYYHCNNHIFIQAVLLRTTFYWKLRAENSPEAYTKDIKNNIHLSCFYSWLKTCVKAKPPRVGDRGLTQEEGLNKEVREAFKSTQDTVKGYGGHSSCYTAHIYTTRTFEASFYVKGYC